MHLKWSCILILLTSSFSSLAQNRPGEKERRYGITLSLPYVNHYHFYHHEKAKDSSYGGFTGIGLAFFMTKGKNKLSFNTGVTADLLAPIGPVDIKYEGESVRMRAKFIELLFHEHLFNRFRVIYGPNYTVFTYLFDNWVTDFRYKKNDHGFGVTAGLEYAFKKNFSVAALYKPALLHLDHKGYKHLLTLDFRFDINLSPRTRQKLGH